MHCRTERSLGSRRTPPIFSSRARGPRRLFAGLFVAKPFVPDLVDYVDDVLKSSYGGRGGKFSLERHGEIQEGTPFHRSAADPTRLALLQNLDRIPRPDNAFHQHRAVQPGKTFVPASDLA